MKIALIGYGKMGKAIEEVAEQRGHAIVLRVSIDNLEDKTVENIGKADVAIEFTGPDSAFDNIKLCMKAGVPVVSGSTGWLSRLDEIHAYCLKEGKSFLYASNFSVGVNIFFEINRQLAGMMAHHPEYRATLVEIHHTEKKDSPSGTAITLAGQILEKIPKKGGWVNHRTQNPEELEILSERTDPAPGTHKVKYASAIDDIEIIHTAHNRQGFALGAVLAAEYIRDKKGIYHMNDVLGF